MLHRVGRWRSPSDHIFPSNDVQREMKAFIATLPQQETRLLARCAMEKLLFVICILLALSSLPWIQTTGRASWDFSVRAGEGLRVDLQVETAGPVEWRVLARGRMLAYSGYGCIARWRSCHA